ncbi:MAG: hypothetical protein U5J62_06640 [Desulfurivibrio sp.]|nr:hypothetical protein [Desulfurivibrio sp.]
MAAMHRYLAIFLLVLLIAGLLFSLYAFLQGRIAEGLLIYPVLVVCYLLSQRHKADR